ncbi:hypothetical protein ACFO4L_11070 [Bacillus daqingensis]|uniref:Uncharacterized protein n=1 Tax=Bacillus daqingensis TaxID=872396 RepID=A0ABV9NZX8_9BACI
MKKALAVSIIGVIGISATVALASDIELSESSSAQDESNQANEDRSHDAEQDNDTEAEETEMKEGQETDSISLDRSEAAEDIAYQEGKREEAEQLIYEVHEAFNNITGYGAIDEFRFADFVHETREFEGESYVPMGSDLSYLLSYLLDDSKLRDDVENARELFYYGVNNEDTSVLRYAHRIMHDLDVYINEEGRQSDKDIFGVTETFGLEKSIERMHDRVNTE